MNKFAIPFVLLAVLVFAGCAVEDPNAQKINASPSATTKTEDPSSDQTAEEVDPPAADPSPDGTYEDSCDYVLGDFTENTTKGFRFIADATLTNTGNIGTINVVKAVWFLGGGDKLVKTKKVKLPQGATRRVGFSVPVNSDQIDLIQSLSGDDCKVTVTMVDTFGTAQD